MAFYDSTQIEANINRGASAFRTGQQNCTMYKKLILCHFLNQTGIATCNNYYGKYYDLCRFIEQTANAEHAGGCKWWTEKMHYLLWDPYQNIEIINEFLQKHVYNDRWIHVNTNQGLDQAGNVNQWIECSVTKKQIRINDNIIDGRIFKSGQKYMVYNNRFKSKFLNDTVLKGQPVETCWACSRYILELCEKKEKERKRREQREAELKAIQDEKDMEAATFKMLHTSDIEWIKDKNVKKCKRCYDEFTFWNRKHHCRSCGDIFCDDCTKKNFTVQYEKEKIDHTYYAVWVRLCIGCHARGYKYCVGAKSHEKGSCKRLNYKVSGLHNEVTRDNW